MQQGEKAPPTLVSAPSSGLPIRWGRGRSWGVSHRLYRKKDPAPPPGTSPRGCPLQPALQAPVLAATGAGIQQEVTGSPRGLHQAAEIGKLHRGQDQTPLPGVSPRPTWRIPQGLASAAAANRMQCTGLGSLHHVAGPDLALHGNVLTLPQSISFCAQTACPLAMAPCMRITDWHRLHWWH